MWVLSSLCVSCSVVSDSVTPWTVAHQAPLSVGFSRQEYWSGLPFPSPKGHFLLSSLLLSKFCYKVHREHNRRQVAQKSENWWANQNDSTGAPRGSWTVRDARRCQGAVTATRPRWQGKEGFPGPEGRGANCCLPGPAWEGLWEAVTLTLIPFCSPTSSWNKGKPESKESKEVSLPGQSREGMLSNWSIRPLLGC